ncbi:MAG TPA: serine kinase [Firmicutes bacterium]|uniref:Serine kinase n=1 Tax=Capillibacterium thermochitinicola TaxID=2699427 RepID=A0A8J6LSX5_9FIRM|nr:DRTGG domain-containing protein [Capillibacterium thermochitinicola]MBA2133637.1 serine kinase [Capillibacterium thermochitinicola]HHW12132.1 serine kinase [Bacillota bacterium]
MTLKELVKVIEANVITGHEKLETTITGVYVSDLLSDVIGHAQEGQAWLTIQTHANVVAVALLLNLAAIVFTAGAEPEAETIAKAQTEGTVLLTTKLPTFETAGRLYTNWQ